MYCIGSVETKQILFFSVFSLLFGIAGWELFYFYFLNDSQWEWSLKSQIEGEVNE